ncbi:MAG: HAD-IIIA family hydrolase [Aquificae bacterium]|nr:HAD-IIIA family hydrolase [Aquificota bacterium]
MDRRSDKEISGVPAEISLYEGFLFDLDGTLINSAKDIGVAVNYALMKLGKATVPLSKIIKHVGYGGRRLMEGVLGTEDEELVDRAVELFREYYFSNPACYTYLYPYVREMLEILKKKDKKVAVITNKYEDISRRILKKLGILDTIDLLVGGDTTPYKKPHPYPVVYAVERLGLDRERTVMIGDSEADVGAGKSAGVKTGLVLFGFGDREKSLQASPDFVINSFSQIISRLDGKV